MQGVEPVARNYQSRREAGEPRPLRRRLGGGPGLRLARGAARPPDKLRVERRRDRLLGLSSLVAFFELRIIQLQWPEFAVDRD